MLLNVLNENELQADESWVRDAYIAILNREPDYMGLQYFVEQLRSGTSSKEDVTANLLNSDEARTAAGMGVFSVPRPDQTRYCFDPWVNLVLKADGSVYPCCSHPAIGKVAADCSLEAVMDGPDIRALRHSLLAGRLDPYCARCRNQPCVDTEHFRRDFALKFFLGDKTMNAAGSVDLNRHPELLRNICFQGAAESCYGLGSRVFLKPTREFPKPSVTFRNIHCDRDLMLKIRIDLDVADSQAATFRICLAGVQRNVVETTLAGKQSSTLALSCAAAGEPFDITYSVRALGANPAKLTAYFSYPFLDDL